MLYAFLVFLDSALTPMVTDLLESKGLVAIYTYVDA